MRYYDLSSKQLEDKAYELLIEFAVSHERIRQIIIKFARKAHHYYYVEHKEKI